MTDSGDERSWYQHVKLQAALLRRRVASAALLPDLTDDAGHDLRNAVREDGTLTSGYVLMCGLSAGIATLGLLQSSVAVVIGAMLVSPLMAPIAALGFGFASLDGQRIREAVKVVAIGAAIGILTGVLITWLSPIKSATSEIIGRTAPTLLDLAIALLSGVAGGYATVSQKGGAAIGVAIATALMPPLAVVGYGLGVMRLDFAGGAMLLFLTNLAAIAFSFALIARLSGAARPLRNVELTPGYIIGGILAFLMLATPLALTLLTVSREASARAATRTSIAETLKIPAANIAQLDVTWPTGDVPVISALAISPVYRANAESVVAKAIEARIGTAPQFTLQQVVAADIDSQTRAIVDAAVERTSAGIARDVPPLLAIRKAIRLPAQAIWVNRGERTVNIVPMAAPGWTLADYRAVETEARKAGDGWQVAVIPPVVSEIFLPADGDEPNAIITGQRDDGIWALNRWQAQDVEIKGIHGRNASQEDRLIAQDYAHAIGARLSGLGITARTSVSPILDTKVPPRSGAIVSILPLRPNGG
jgi:uncharacterized hydrophobic protein (TIGR00271 family)